MTQRDARARFGAAIRQYEGFEWLGHGNARNVIAVLRSRWILFTVVVPLGTWFLSLLAARIEQRRGSTPVTRALRWPRDRRRSSRAASAA